MDAGPRQDRQGTLGNQEVVERMRLAGLASDESAESEREQAPTSRDRPTVADVVFARGNDATPDKMGEVRARLRVIASNWGLPFADDQVRLANDVAGRRIQLTWPSAWGGAPQIVDIPSSFQAIEARMAVAVARAASGWALLAADTQGRLEALLGGEVNLLSRACRYELRSLRGAPSWGTMSAADQAKALEGLLTDRRARPGIASEPVSATAAEHVLSGPILAPSHAFRGSTADADRYALTFTDGQVVTILAPHAPDPTLHAHTVAQVVVAVAKLPVASRSRVKTVTLNPVTNPEDAFWAAQYDQAGFHSYMTAGVGGDVTIYPDKTSIPSQGVMNQSLIHETGHTWSYQVWGQDTTKGGWVAWRAAMASDVVAVSNYAVNDIAEDVAETVQIYRSTLGGPAHAEYAALVPARWSILTEQLK